MDRFEQLDPIEASLRELIDAERVGLFRRTHVDARSLLQSANSVNHAPRFLRRIRWFSIAAILTLAVTIYGWIFISGTGPTRLASLSSEMLASATDRCDRAFFACLTGPNGTPATACTTYDYDSDGDIDLADARTYQLNCNGLKR